MRVEMEWVCTLTINDYSDRSGVMQGLANSGYFVRATKMVNYPHVMPSAYLVEVYKEVHNTPKEDK